MADAQDSKSCDRKIVWVRLPPPAPRVDKTLKKRFTLFVPHRSFTYENECKEDDRVERFGTWWLRSRVDPRWNAEGRGMVGGGLATPRDCETRIKELELRLGVPPKDLEVGWMKD